MGLCAARFGSRMCSAGIPRGAVMTDTWDLSIGRYLHEPGRKALCIRSQAPHEGSWFLDPGFGRIPTTRKETKGPQIRA